MGAPMRGLSQFIADLRNSKAEEEEIKRVNAEIINIQKNFATPGLSGQQRKKYVCKLIYIYILGYKINIGIMESIQLMASKVYSEKEIGYLAASLFLNESHELMTLIINCVENDFDVDDHSFNCLALALVANLCSEEWAQQFGEKVFMFIRSPTTPPFVKKKACLTLLKLIKVDPALAVRYQSSWLPRIVALLDQNGDEIGLILCAVSLISYFAKVNPHMIKAAIPLIINRLSAMILEGKCPQKYVYYGIPDPWLTVKLLNLIEDLILVPNAESKYHNPTVTNIDAANLDKLQQIVSRTINYGRKKSVTDKSAVNAQNAILFAAVSLATRLDPSLEAITGVIDALGQLLESKETNTRYLALNAMIKIVSGFQNGMDDILVRADYTAKSDQMYLHNSIKKHLPAVLALLKDKDVSVRSKALDVLCFACDLNNVEAVVAELIAFLEHSDFSSKRKVSLKVYNLIEKFAKDYSWYVSSTYKALGVSGPNASPEIWQKFCTIVVNSENRGLKTFATKSAFRIVRQEQSSNWLIYIAAFLLGEYGNYIVQTDAQYSPQQQFNALYANYFFSTTHARYLILTTFLKLYKKFPELRGEISKFYRQELNSINAEIQQRAVEYIQVSSKAEYSDLLDAAANEMPEFKTKTKLTILKRLDKSTVASDVSEKNLIEFGAEANSEDGNTTRDELMSPQYETNPFNEDSDSYSDVDELLKQDTSIPRVVLTPNWKDGFLNLMFKKKGVFFENSMIRVDMETDDSELKKSKKVLLTFGIWNKSPSDVTSLITNVLLMSTVNPPITVKNLSYPDSTLHKKQSASWQVEVTFRNPFEDKYIPVLELSFLSGGFSFLKLKLPLSILKAMSGTVLSQKHFDMRWSQVAQAGNAELEAEAFVPVAGCLQSLQRFSSLKLALVKTGWGECAQGNDNVMLAAGIIHTYTSGNFGTLLSVEYLPETDQYHFVVRSTNEAVPKVVIDSLVSLISE